MKRAAIKAISSYLPVGELTNDQLVEEFGDVDAGVILERTGIRVRHIAGREECASDLGVAAARHLFESNPVSPVDVDFLLFCTQSPDYFLPTTACIMQERLGLRTDCGAIDFNQGCSGYVYGLSLAKSLIETEVARSVLLITADTYTRYINAGDRSVRTLFGDGASATLISAVSESGASLIGPFVFGTDGRGAQQLIVPAGGMRRPLDADAMIETEDEQGNRRSPQNLYMNGPEIFNFTLRTVPQVLDELLKKSGRSLEEIDYFIPHQANKFMLERLQRRLKIPAEKFHIELENTGNTVSSTIPIALESARQAGRIKAGDTVALIGFGVGYSWAATLVSIV